MKITNCISLFLLFLLPFSLSAQNTVGTIQNDPGSLNGYTFFSPFSGTKAYLVDNCGRLINEWDRGTSPGLAAYFLENGLMFRTYKVDTEGPFTSASNAGGLELVDWDNNTVWSYEINTPTQLSHHDAVYMPNGNILVLTWELVYTDELVENGRDPNEIAVEGYMWSERIQELEPVGSNEANIVWEWEIKDHYIQDFDSTKLNYGVIADHPELFNINLPELNSSNSNSTRDWNHFNAIDYHPELDQILISVRNSDEIWIIDHSTTTAEAATHTGGTYGKGGDLLYRWGNASAYERAPVSEQKLFGQHGVHWIREGLNDSGKILIFNNGNGRPGPDYSTAEILVPTQDAYGGYILPETDPFGPTTTEWKYGNDFGEGFYSPYLSNAQRLENGNMLVNPGSTGEIFEIDEEKDIVWRYVIPLFGDFPASQGQNVNNNSTFRAYRYTDQFPGLENQDLTPGATIEEGTDPNSCEIFVSTENDFLKEQIIEIVYHSSNNTLEVSNPDYLKYELSFYNVSGQFIFSEKINSDSHLFNLPVLAKGIYFVAAMAEGGEVYSEKISIF